VHASEIVNDNQKRVFPPSDDTVMLDSEEETQRIAAARRRCRSLDALPCGGSDVLLWFTDENGGIFDHVTGIRRTFDRQQATGGNGETGRCLSTSDLLTAGDGQCCQQCDDYDPSWCSVNNLETDCVSPRVSSNSLFSQLDVGTAASSDEVGDHPPASSSYRLTAASGRRTPCGFGVPGEDQPMYTRHSRQVPPQTTAGQQVPTTFLLRQLTTVAGGGTPQLVAFGYDDRRSSMAVATRSASCPSLVYDHCDGSTHQQTDHTHQPLPHKTEHGVSVGEEHASRDQVRAADKLPVDGILLPVSIITHSTGSAARAPMQCLTARPSRSASPPTTSGQDASVRDYVGVRRPVDDGGRKTRQRGVSGSSAMTAGRTTQRLARTKCLQWLNSFDEDD